MKQTNFTLEEIEQIYCPLCQRDDYILITKEWGNLGVVRCKKCNLIYVNPRLKNPEKKYWGDKESYLREAKLIFEGKAPHHRDSNYLEELNIIEKIKPTGNFLDIGTNMGFFLRMARGRGWTLFGLEPSPTLSAIARDKFSLNIKNSFLENSDYQDNFFDVVTLIDVFEHIKNPLEFLGHVRRILKKDGLLFIKVPNGDFNLWKYRAYISFLRYVKFKEDIFRDIFDSKEHILHYTEDSLRRMLKAASFEIKKFMVPKHIQVPTWRSLVGEYFHYPTPWFVDWHIKSARASLYWSAKILYLVTGKIWWMAPNIVALATKGGEM